MDATPITCFVWYVLLRV